MTDVRQRTARWLFKEVWDFDRVPDPEAMHAYAKALLACANGDGRLAPEEREWVVGFGAAVGFSESFLEELASYAADDDPAELVARSEITDSPSVRLSIVYDAVRACGADGEITDEERERIYRMAEKLGILHEGVDAVVEQYNDETRVRAARLDLIYGESVKPF